MSRTTRTTRAAGVLAGAAAGLVAFALPASAHVSVQPPSAAAGSYATLSFKVPTESDTASTTGLDIQFPADTPIASVSVQPKAGWTYEVKKAKPSTPVTVHGSPLNEVVTEIIWTAQGSGGIRPGEFDTFAVSAGPLPEKAGSLAFKTLQTYSDGQVVRWIDVAGAGQPEPERPAPSLELTAATDDHDAGGAPASPAAASDATASDAAASDAAAGGGGAAGSPAASGSGSDGTARGLGIAGLVLGALGLGAGGFAVLTGRRRAQG
jgi:uncharacterized protein